MKMKPIHLLGVVFVVFFGGGVGLHLLVQVVTDVNSDILRNAVGIVCGVILSIPVALGVWLWQNRPAVDTGGAYSDRASVIIVEVPAPKQLNAPKQSDH